MVLTRRAGIKAFYNKKEVELSTELSSLTITDNISSAIDSIDFVLKNNKNRLLNKDNELCIGEKFNSNYGLKIGTQYQKASKHIT
ncbi:hypothetical protein H3N56_02790 [Cetobacterium sp. 2A]|uniref:hypothetical protein n=1 Tax=Cetobacterium sp. 2A TaxID=2754723 RepID=UPI00163BFEBB|nr:hypothetical protein [Cetobacterium sp. 2A]MBC2855421.1 hypothetical protein [Cetobacterium sp. 2A]